MVIKNLAIEMVGLLFLFEVKHFLADFVFQSKYMLRKVHGDWTFFIPLTAHAGVHGIWTFVGLLIYMAGSIEKSFIGICFVLGVFDGVTHFFIDRLKAGPRYLGRYKDVQTSIFWWCIGLDQLLHHFIMFIIIYTTVKFIYGF